MGVLHRKDNLGLLVGKKESGNTEYPTYNPKDFG
jgi:hypothetical protein